MHNSKQENWLIYKEITYRNKNIVNKKHKGEKMKKGVKRGAGVGITTILLILTVLTAGCSDSKDKVAIKVENNLNYEVKIVIIIDGDNLGYAYIDGNGEDWFRPEGYYEGDQHTIKLIVEDLYGLQHNKEVTLKKNVCFTIHENYEITYLEF